MIRSFRIFGFKKFHRKSNYSDFRTEINKQKTEIPLLQKLSSEFDDVSFISEAIDKDERLSSIGIEEWRERINLFKSYAFTDRDCFKMISLHPALLETPTEDLKKTTAQWNICPFKMEHFQYLLVTTPIVLDVESREIKKRIPYLNSLFKSNKSIIDLLIHCPNIMFDNWASVTTKIDYLLKKRGMERKDLLQSQALMKSLDFIKLRFDVLEKTGVYKKPIMHAHKKNKYQTLEHTNPHLKYITDTNDYDFSNQIAGITIEEYKVYQDLYETYDEKETDSDDNFEEY